LILLFPDIFLHLIRIAKAAEFAILHFILYNVEQRKAAVL